MTTVSPENSDIEAIAVEGNHTTAIPKCETQNPFSSITFSQPKSVCFVCTGNTCRSPMAAAVANALGKDMKIKAISAGLYPHTGDAISDNALSALLKKGFVPSSENPFDRHTAAEINESIVAKCDLIVGITDSHLMTLIHSFPAYAQKLTSMPKSISDPYGGDLNCYIRCLDEIIKGVKELLSVGNP